MYDHRSQNEMFKAHKQQVYYKSIVTAVLQKMDICEKPHVYYPNTYYDTLHRFKRQFGKILEDFCVTIAVQWFKCLKIKH